MNITDETDNSLNTDDLDISDAQKEAISKLSTNNRLAIISALREKQEIENYQSHPSKEALEREARKVHEAYHSQKEADDDIARDDQSVSNEIKKEEDKSKIDYSKYGKGFTKEFIDTMLADKHFARAMIRTSINEGEYSNHPADKGGETNYGISSKIYPNEDIKNMTKERATAIYYRDYWLKPKINQLPDEFAEIVFDNGVIQGQSTAIMNLQKALGIRADGIIGSKTLSALKKTDYKSIRVKFIKNANQVEDKYQKKDPTQKVFEKGHRKRYNSY